MTATTSERDHRELIDGLSKQLRIVMDGSAQGIYLYLDDRHKACNQRFAQMLGYDSAAEWDQPGSFTELYVEEQSRQPLVRAYRQAMEKQIASTLEVTWKRRDGRPVSSSVILVPVTYDGELFALHFVTPRE